ncbi:DUF4255 domain-containing protein [Chitinophaga oryzae]|uniref:DUF4255 domain-containing protein n=1 Tax=Chitinophaga oryzae TaxID=2725414 RepID=A0ABX6LEJ6_9BACT|nr:DUF4255 domain-containing protein [Chitinophaga oryzae]QJB38539.1 DUF4255 domain-containing protein [Chitinophaga oryzae]
MLTEILTIIRDSLTPQFAGGDFDLGNIASPGNAAPSVLLTLVNLKEEPSLKNTAYSRVNNATLKTEYFNPYVFLNAYILFSSRKSTYKDAVSDIGKIIRFIHGQNQFSTSYNGTDFRVVLNMYSPSFEEMNHLWAILGGKVYPSIMYVMRVIELHNSNVVTGDGVIETITGKFSVIDPKK